MRQVTFALALLGSAWCWTRPGPLRRIGPARATPLAHSSPDSAPPGYTAVMIVPTGIGASIGGYAGDALPSARLLASIADTLITHPNVLNGAMLYWPVPNILYVEGYALDEFAAGALALRRVRSNRVGLLLDGGMEEELRLRHMQVADAFRATLGVDIHAACATSTAMGVDTFMSSGASWGSVRNTPTLLEAGRWLVGQGCDAIAVVARFPEDEEEEEEGDGHGEGHGHGEGDGDGDGVHRKDGIDRKDGKDGKDREGGGGSASLFQDYRQGQGVDAIAGAEAIISHILTKDLLVPCAHAPAFLPSEAYPLTSPKACAEELGYTFLPCILAYLHTAPRLVPTHAHTEANTPSQTNTPSTPNTPSQANTSSQTNTLCTANPHATHAEALRPSDLTRHHVSCVVVPHSALGGPAVLSFLALARAASSSSSSSFSSSSSSSGATTDNGSGSGIGSSSIGSGSGSSSSSSYSSASASASAISPPAPLLIIAVLDNDSNMRASPATLGLGGMGLGDGAVSFAQSLAQTQASTQAATQAASQTSTQGALGGTARGTAEGGTGTQAGTGQGETETQTEKEQGHRIVYARSYCEAAGIMAAHKAGLLLSATTAHVPPLRLTQL